MWREIIFTVERAQVEPWSDALLAAGAMSVQAEDADADSPDEQALFGEPGLPTPPSDAWRHTRLAALVGEDDDPAALLERAAHALARPVPPRVEVRSFDDQDWVRASQAQFEPIPVGERLLITPSWHEAPSDRVSIVLDPGLAFGTGSHPTTRLCLQWLEREMPHAATVIDYGCGSGILAIAAARLGAASVVAIDIDPQALLATRANAERNRVTLDVRGTTDAMPAPARVVLANILSMPLKLLAPLLWSLTVPGGALVLSGLLERQIDEVAQAYPREARMHAWRIDEGWACLVGHKD